VAVRPFGGMQVKRTWFAADKTGFHILHTLVQTSLKYPAIERFDQYYTTDLLVEDGRCRGCTALDMRAGQLKQFNAKAVIICAGGAGRIFPFTTNGAIKTGDGMALAYRAGSPLKDMEFVQYHPTGMPGTGILLTEGCRGEGAVLLNRHGYRYLQDYGMGPETPLGQPVLKTMELGPRDRLSQAFWHEQRKGNTVPTPWGDCVHLDMRHLGEAIINERLPLVRDLASSYLQLDPVTELIPIRPVVHYMMGGIHTDVETATSLPGLFAAGECACVSINGANRLGSNSLTELLVFGKRAALSAVEYIDSAETTVNDTALDKLAGEAQGRVRDLFLKTNGTESIAGLRGEMTHAMETGAGIYRTQESLDETCEKIAELRHRYAGIELQDKSNVFNTDLFSALELKCMLDVAEAVAVAARERKESRGSHQRLDFEQRDDANYLKHSLAYHQGDQSPRIDYLDVVITRSPPGVRDYSGE
jgi:fumarate reductase flavoprotein subunit